MMKISELIKHLQDYLDKKGDDNVMIRYTKGDWKIGSTDVKFRDVDALLMVDERD